MTSTTGTKRKRISRALEFDIRMHALKTFLTLGLPRPKPTPKKARKT